MFKPQDHAAHVRKFHGLKRKRDYGEEETNYNAESHNKERKKPKTSDVAAMRFAVGPVRAVGDGPSVASGSGTPVAGDTEETGLISDTLPPSNLGHIKNLPARAATSAIVGPVCAAGNGPTFALGSVAQNELDVRETEDPLEHLFSGEPSPQPGEEIDEHDELFEERAQSDEDEDWLKDSLMSDC